MEQRPKSGGLLGARLAANLWCCRAGQEVAGWGAAQVTKTDLLAGETNFGKHDYFFASVMTRAGCHVAKVEGERGKELFVRRDGRRGKGYLDIAQPVFSRDGKHIAFSAKKGRKAVIVLDGREHGEYDSIPAGPVFRSDGVLEFLAADRSSLYRIEVRGF